MQTIFKNNFILWLWIKTRAPNIPSKTAFKEEMLYGHHLWDGRHLVFFFPKYAVYFKLHYFKLIHLQANLLSLFISTFFAVNHTN